MSDPLSFEVVNYATPYPRNLAVLTAMGLIFDKVIFPGVHLPATGYDKKAYFAELERLRSLRVQYADDARLLEIFSFLQFVPILSGFCEFTGTDKDVFGRSPENEKELLAEVELATWGPRQPNFIPMIDSGHNKGLGDQNFISYPGELHYRAAAIVEAAGRGATLLTDEPQVRIPSVGTNSAGPSARSVASILALHSAALVLPEMRVMRPSELMEFRDRHSTEMRRFRRGMLKHAGELSADLRSAKPDEVEGVVNDYIDTKIAPELDQLREVARQSTRTNSQRFAEGAIVATTFGTGVLAGGLVTGAVAALVGLGHFAAAEIGAARDAKAARTQNDLFYLLTVEQASK